MKIRIFSTLSAFALAPLGNAIVDINTNGVSDFWERDNNAGELFSGTFDPQADPDSDGWTNSQEAVAGTNPLDPSPPDGLIRPEIAHIPAVLGEPDQNGVPTVITPEAVTVAWPTHVGKQYTLLFSPDLTEGSWIPVGDPFIGSGNQVTYGFEIIGSDKRFWRVSVQDVDSDSDGLNNAEEFELGTNSEIADTDHDGIDDFAEFKHSTSPILWDTDGDGSGDGEEVSEGKDPLSADSFPPQWRYVERKLHYSCGDPDPESPGLYSHLFTEQFWEPSSTSAADFPTEIGWAALPAQLANSHAFPATPASPRRVGLGSWINEGQLLPFGEPPINVTLRDRRYWLVIDSPKDTPVARKFLKFTRRTVNANAPTETAEQLSAIVQPNNLASSPIDVCEALTTSPAVHRPSSIKKT